MGMPRKTKTKQPLPVSTYAEWRKRVAALLERTGIWAGVPREKRWRDLFIEGATPEQAVGRAEVEHNNARTTFERQKRR
jgi:hypothetical protein